MRADTVAEAKADAPVGGLEEAGIGGWNGGTEKSSEMTGAGAGSAGMPP
jgi:hypothetical protein